MAVLRSLLGDALRSTRLAQRRTLREVSSAARVSLGYLSEVERGQKEASSELLASICAALGVRLSDVLRDVSDVLAEVEPRPVPVRIPVLEPVGSGPDVVARVEVARGEVARVEVGRRRPAEHEVVAAA